jgi:hypothetical protein
MQDCDPALSLRTYPLYHRNHEDLIAIPLQIGEENPKISLKIP